MCKILRQIIYVIIDFSLQCCIVDFRPKQEQEKEQKEGHEQEHAKEHEHEHEQKNEH